MTTQNLTQSQQKCFDECGYPYKFSVVMAVYNVEAYLREAVDSLLNQTIGFEENVQLILINDGSPDNSGTICDEYGTRYPNNVFVIHKENGGVASARNAGLEHVQGRYVNFMDSDDTITDCALEKVYVFFIANDAAIDLVSIPLIFFEAKSGAHQLNYRFNKGTRIIDLRMEYTNILLFTNSSYIKADKIPNICFDPELVHGEDAKEILKVLVERHQFGVVHDCAYNYRRRTGENLSLIQSSRSKKGYYIAYLKQLSLWAYEFFERQLGYIPWFVQYAVIYDIQWKIMHAQFPEGLLSDMEKDEFFELLSVILRKTDDKIILEQKNITSEYKYFLMCLKYGKQPDITPRSQNALISFNNNVIHSLSDGYTVLSFLDVDNNCLQLEGFLAFTGIDENTEIMLRVNDNHFVKAKTSKMSEVYALGNRVSVRVIFVCSLQLDMEGLTKIEVCCRLSDGTIVHRRRLHYGAFMPVADDYSTSYYVKNNWKFTASKSSIAVMRCGFIQHVKCELKFLWQCLKSKNAGVKKVLLARCSVQLAKLFMRKEIWVISDRRNRGDDNGEAFFEYLVKNKPLGITPVFSIDKTSPDFKRISKIGKVVPFLSSRYKLYRMLGATFISSQADDEYIEPTKYNLAFYRDLIADSRFVFLQHGIISNDLSEWLGRYKKNLALFVTSTNREYESILMHDYFYSEKHVKLTGLPRHDKLYDDSQRTITIMPTWRKYLTNINSSGERFPVDGFTESTYFAFYNNLLNCDELLQAAKKLEYKLQFFPHPHMRNSMHLFAKNEYVTFLNSETPYSKVFAESDMVVSDYSSVVYDFAYLRKPLIYTQFDSDDFFSGNHVYKKGSFDYDSDGFGEVETTFEGLISRMIEYMKNGCQLKDKYRKRIDSTFPFADKNNCKRVYDAIRNMSK